MVFLQFGYQQTTPKSVKLLFAVSNSIFIKCTYDDDLNTLDNVNVHINSDANVQDTSTSIAAVQHFLTHHNNVDIVGLVQCTSPFVSSSYLSDAVNAVKSGIECAFSVTR